MSLYKDASLVMIPSAYKDGKLYSIRPTDGSGDFTFSRGSNLAATRVDVNGLIEKGRENVLLHSNDFTLGNWGNDAGACTRTGGQSGYDGTNDAWLITQDTAGYDNIRSLSTGLTSGISTMSVYAKAGTSSNMHIRIPSDASRVQFNLSTGVATNKGGAIHQGMDAVGGGWYRCYATFNSNVDLVQIYPDFGSSTPVSIYIQDAQLEAGLVATDYIETTSSTAQAGILEDMPRLDYSGGASCPALLLEPQRTNLLAYSEYLEGSGWNKSNAGTGSSPVISTNTNDTTSPEGEYNATKIVFDAGSGTTTGDLSLLEGVVAIAASTEASTSIWLKGENGGEQLHMRGVANGAFQIITLTTEWQQFTTSENSSTTTDSLQFGIRQNVSGLGVINSSATIYAYGAQIEEGSYPTSYIPNYGASVTRSGDSSSLTGVGDLLGDSNGTLFVEVETFEDNAHIVLSDGTLNNVFPFRFRLTNFQNDMKVDNEIQSRKYRCILNFY